MFTRLIAAAACCILAAGCHQASKAEVDEALKAAGGSMQRPEDMPRNTARKQIGGFIAKVRTYPEFYLAQGIINPRITEAKISGPFTSRVFSTESTYYCVDYKLQQPIISQNVHLRAYPSIIIGPKGTLEVTRIARGRAEDCGTPYEAFPELEKLRDENIAFRKAHPGEMNDSITFMGGQL